MAGGFETVRGGRRLTDMRLPLFLWCLLLCGVEALPYATAQAVATEIAASETPAADVLRMEHVANAGVLLGCGEELVLVDGLYREGVPGYEVIPPLVRNAIESARPPYDSVRLVVATHRHRDHFDAAAVARHLSNNPRARFVGTPEAVEEVRAYSAVRVREAKAPESFALHGVKLRFYAIPHNPTPTGPVEHQAVEIQWCGKTLLFTGDADFKPELFRKAGVQPGRTDVLFAPFWITMSEPGRKIVREVIQPKQIWALHGDLEARERWMDAVQKFDPQARIGRLP